MKNSVFQCLCTYIVHYRESNNQQTLKWTSVWKLETWDLPYAPSPEAFPFLNRKQYHSINIQIISDEQYNLLNVVAHWPEEAHDSFVLQNSAFGMGHVQGVHGDGWLIGE